MADEKNLPPHLRGLSPGQRERLTPELNREIADLHTSSERRDREYAAAVRSGTLAELPDYLAGLDRPPALLYLALPESFDVEHTEEVGAWFGLDADGAARALDALQRAELARPSPELPGRYALLPPGSVPF